jgi:hypothetical protein
MALILKGRSKLKGSTVIGKRPYAIDGVFNPELVLDFQKNYYRTNSVAKTFPNAITHTRASTATYVDSTGTLQTAAINEPRVGHHVWNGTAWVNEGLLHESEARTNLLTYSEDLSNAAWLKTGVTIGTPVTRKGISLDLLTSTGTGTFRDLSQSVGSVSNGAYVTLSVFVEAGTSTENAIRIDDGTPTNRHTVPITWTAGVPTLQANITAGLTPVSASVQDYGDGLYRIHIAVLNGTGGALTLNARYYVVWDDSSAPVTVYAGGFQAEIGPTPSSYIPTSGSTVTRSADVLTIPAANLPYPEPVVIGPELVTNGTFDADSAWTKGTSAVIANGYLEQPSGTNSFTHQLFTTEAGKVYEVSFEVLQGQFFSGVWSTAPTSTVLSNSADTRGVGLRKIYFVANDGNATFSFLANATGGVLSRIDNISVREINPLALSIQMDGRVTYADTDNGTEARFFFWQKSGSAYLLHYIQTDGAKTGQIILAQFNGGTFDATATSATYLSPDILVPYSISGRHGSTFINGATDGVLLAAGVSSSLPDLSATNLELGQAYNGTIRTFRIWAQDIGDAGLVEATEPSLVPSLSLTFDGTENSFIVEDWSE